MCEPRPEHPLSFSCRADSKKKAKKSLSLISFEDEEGGEEAAGAARICSAHDSLQDSRCPSKAFAHCPISVYASPAST